MADLKKEEKNTSPVSPVRSTDGRPESPTTAQPLDFDDDHEATAPTPPKPTTASDTGPRPPPKDENPPAKPPRPLNPREQAELTLREAFPTIEPSVIRAVLRASGGSLEPAFNALLEMSDPDAAAHEEAPPAMPPRPVKQPTATPTSQLEADEMYARQLHEHYSGSARQEAPTRPNRYNEHLQGSRQGRPGASPNPDDVPWRSFIDDDLPEIRDNIKKGFFETQKTVNSWITTFKKRIDGEEEEDDFNSQPAREGQNYGQQQPYGRRSGEMGRRSADMSRYDADPQVIGDDFSKLELRDGDHPPRMSSRPAANPNLFRSESRKSSAPGIVRKVSFQEGPPEEIGDMYSGSTKTTTVQAPVSTAKSSKWQPLTSVDPSPVTENDPFSLGDSDDEKDAKPISMKDEEVTALNTGAETTTKEGKGAEAKSDTKN